MKKDSGTEINYDLKNETLKLAVKIRIDFLSYLIIFTNSLFIYERRSYW